MTQFEYTADLPFPKSKEKVAHRLCYFEIEDLNQKIDFKNDELYFEVNYLPSGTEKGSIRAYMQNYVPTKDTYRFVYIVAHNSPFTIKITSNGNCDLTKLNVKLKPIQ